MRIRKIILLMTMCLLCTFMAACTKGKDQQNDAPTTYTVQLKNVIGQSMEGTGIRVYADASKQQVVAAGRLNENGEFSFSTQDAMGYFIFFEGEFDGFTMEESYVITDQRTEIVLDVELLDEIPVGTKIGLGDVMADILVTTPDGEEYRISQLLETKPVVVLNFWYINCMPCQMEFPYLQEAYMDYEHSVEVLAINPYDGTDKNVAAFQEEKGYTFPMAAADISLAELFGVKSYPTTIVIDRYGVVCMFHEGSVTDKETFVKIFDFFAGEDYEHTVIKRLSELE